MKKLVPLLLLAVSASAQPRVLVRLHEPPPGRMDVLYLWWVDVDNRTGQTLQDVWFEGMVFERDHGRVYWAKTRPFDLAPGQATYRLRDVDIERQEYLPGFEVFFYRTGEIPEGDYRYRVILMPLGVGDSGSAKVRMSAPPRLISPRDGAVLPVSRIGPLFTWTPPMPPPPGGVRHRLTLVEVMDGQGAEEAMRSNRPWYVNDRVPGAMLRYPVSARALEPGRRYAWQVVSFRGRALLGRSEVREFGYQSPETTEVNPFSWDVESRRTLLYHLTMTEEQDGKVAGEMAADVELQFLGSGRVRLTFRGLEGSANTEG